MSSAAVRAASTAVWTCRRVVGEGRHGHVLVACLTWMRLDGKPVSALWPEDGEVAWVDLDGDGIDELPELSGQVNQGDQHLVAEH